MARKDEDIKKDIVDRLYWDDRVDASKVEVIVEDGKVTLKGTVPSYLARVAAFDDAWTVSGVKSVINELVVSPPKTPSDEDIRREVKNRLLTSPSLETADIEITVTNGVVTLKGLVDALWKKQRAEELASEVRGVTAVKNELAVVPTGSFIDEEVAKRIIQALDRDTRVRAEDITVEVRNGIVTLTGTVPDRIARRAAYEAALYTSGVKEIDDKLNVALAAVAA